VARPCYAALGDQVREENDPEHHDDEGSDDHLHAAEDEPGRSLTPAALGLVHQVFALLDRIRHA